MDFKKGGGQPKVSHTTRPGGLTTEPKTEVSTGSVRDMKTVKNAAQSAAGGWENAGAFLGFGNISTSTS